MEKVFQIQLAGILFTIEEQAYLHLKNYLDKLHHHFQNNQEIVLDIESRMAELFQQRLGSNRNTILIQDVTEVTDTLGNIAQMEEHGNAQNQKDSGASQLNRPKIHKLRRNPNDEYLGGVCSGIASFFDLDPVLIRVLFVLLLVAYGSGILMYLILWAVVPKANEEEASQMRLQRENRNRRLFRDPDSRVIGGVSSGLANYFGLDRVWIRLAFVVGIFLFGTGFWLYIVMWIIVPKACSASEKLLMKGETVDIKNIEKEILKNQITNKVNSIAVHGSNLISIIIKGILKLIGSFFAFILFIIVISISIAMVALFFNMGNTQWLNELIDLTIKDQSIIYAAKLGILFTLLIPFVALLMVVVRSLFKIKLTNKTWGITLGGIFMIGLLLLAYSGIRFANSIKYSDSRNTVYKLGAKDTLLIEGIEMPIIEDNLNENELSELTFSNKGVVIDKDKVYFEIDNFKVRTGKSDSVSLKIVFQSSGHDQSDANFHMNEINYPVKIENNKIILPAYFSIDKDKVFRWQEVDVVLSAPSGTILNFDNASKDIIDDQNLDEADGNIYKLKNSGLKCLDCGDGTDVEETDEDLGSKKDTHHFNFNMGDKEENSKVDITFNHKNKTGISSKKYITITKNGKTIKTEETKIGPMVIKEEVEIKN